MGAPELHIDERLSAIAPLPGGQPQLGVGPPAIAAAVELLLEGGQAVEQALELALAFAFVQALLARTPDDQHAVGNLPLAQPEREGAPHLLVGLEARIVGLDALRPIGQGLGGQFGGRHTGHHGVALGAVGRGPR